MNWLLDPIHLSLLLVLLGLFPWLGRERYLYLQRNARAGDPKARLRHYRFIFLLEWVSVAVLVPAWFLSGRDAGGLGLTLRPDGWEWATIAAAFIVSAALIVQLVKIRGNEKELEGLRRQLGDLTDMVPRDKNELRSFDFLSLTAGICEEIIYRGALLSVLSLLVGTWLAVLISSVVFGLGHIYQGGTGFLRTATVGLVLAVLTVLSGSIYPAILVHIILDVTSGRLMKAAIEIDLPSPKAAASHS